MRPSVLKVPPSALKVLAIPPSSYPAVPLLEHVQLLENRPTLLKMGIQNNHHLTLVWEGRPRHVPAQTQSALVTNLFEAAPMLCWYHLRIIQRCSCLKRAKSRRLHLAHDISLCGVNFSNPANTDFSLLCNKGIEELSPEE